MRILSKLKKGEHLYLKGDKQKKVYLVVRGLLADASYDDKGRRQLLSVALPGMALMTSSHLYSRKPSLSDIIVLRTNSLIIEIPYSAVLELKEQEVRLNTLISILINKHHAQVKKLRIVGYSIKPIERYKRFLEHTPELYRILTNLEAADLLGISIATVKRARKTPKSQNHP